MICRPCRLAGGLVRGYQEGLTANGFRPAFEEQRVRGLHDYCKGGTHCCCQHKLSGVNYALAESEEA